MNFNVKRTWGPFPSYSRVKNYKDKNKFEFKIIGGPCSVESSNQIKSIASVVSSHGANYLRGGVFRAGTYPPGQFGFVSDKLIKAYFEAAKDNGLKNIVEILDYSPKSLDAIYNFSDCFQIGARSMQNYTLLDIAGRLGKPVFIKRHPGATLDELLGSCEYLLRSGCEDLTIIERGSVSHVDHVRWDLSVSMICAIKKITEIPVIVDASHGSGRRDLVLPLTRAGIAAGADGMLLEVHYDPVKSISDADQAIDFKEFIKIIKQSRIIRQSIFN